MKDAAEPDLTGDVGPATAGGVIRYRLWPARRHPVRTALIVLGAGVSTALTWYAFENAFWAFLVAVGLVLGAALWFFPTEVSLDGATLHVRQLGTPRTWDLRDFRRMTVGGKPLPRVTLTQARRLARLRGPANVILPLPEDEEYAERVVMHLRRWVARQHTGRFELDADHAPEDNVEA